MTSINMNLVKQMMMVYYDFAAESAAVCALSTITSFASMVITTASPVNLPATDNVAPDPRHVLASPAKSVAMDQAAKLCLL
jgi:hypothetical protein